MPNPRFTAYWLQSRVITAAADTGTTLGAIEVPADTFVSQVVAYVKTAFSATGTVDVGDGSNTAGWLPSAQLAPTVVGFKTGTRGGNAYSSTGGKGYTSADTIDVQVYDNTSGSLFIMAELIPMAGVK